MSADNWALCPVCHERASKIKAELRDRVRLTYGRLPIDEWDKLRAEADADINVEALHTFREDYEIYGAEDGLVKVSYSGGCKECGAHVEFKHEHVVESTP